MDGSVTKRLLIIAIILLGLASVVAVLLYGLWRAVAMPYSVPMVVLKIPDGFRGLIELRTAPLGTSQASITPFVETSAQQFEVRVPDSGLVLMSDLALLTDWHQIVAETIGGEIYSVEYSPVPAVGQINLYELGTTSEGSTWYLVGDEADYEWYITQQWYSESTPRPVPGPIRRADQ